MRSTQRTQRKEFLGLPLVSFVLASAAFPNVAPRGRIDVQFLADGRCTVSAEGETFHSSLTYTPPAVAQSYELRCAIPPIPAGVAVDLSVALPGGVTPLQGDDDPRLTWTHRDNLWFGSAALTTAPSLVRIPEADSPKARRARNVRRGAAAACAVLLAAGVAVGVRRWRR
jgi:hypothetical protein